MKKKNKELEKFQDKLKDEALKPEKYESRYKHGGPGRTVKKKKEIE